MLLDILIILFIGISLWKMKPITTLKEINNDYLSLKTCNSYKGFFAIIVILHHLSQRISEGAILRNFTGIGYLAVAIFFFFSGYGLQKKNLSDPTYSHGFLIKRIPTILIPYAIMTFIYWLTYALLGDVRTISDMWTEFYKWGNPIVWFSWYVVSILAFYIAFYLLMKIFKQNKPGIILGSVAYYVLYVIILRKLSYGTWWYMTAFIPIVGIIWASYNEKITEFLKKTAFFLMPLIWVLYLILDYYKPQIRSAFPPSWEEAIFCMIMSLVFVLGVILTSTKFKFGNKLLNFLGNISFELYMVQGLFMLIFRNDLLYINNSIIWSLLVIVCSVIFAFLLNILFKFILKKYKKLIKC